MRGETHSEADQGHAVSGLSRGERRAVDSGESGQSEFFSRDEQNAPEISTVERDL